jgi:hypothetical protein
MDTSHSPGRTRYEHRADLHLGLLQLACAIICYRQLEASL